MDRLNDTTDTISLLLTRRSTVAKEMEPPGPDEAQIEQLTVAGNFVTTVERAYWVQDGVEVSQASLAVYEIRDGFIYRVWYYPAFD